MTSNIFYEMANNSIKEEEPVENSNIFYEMAKQKSPQDIVDSGQSSFDQGVDLDQDEDKKPGIFKRARDYINLSSSDTMKQAGIGAAKGLGTYGNILELVRAQPKGDDPRRFLVDEEGVERQRQAVLSSQDPERGFLGRIQDVLTATDEENRIVGGLPTSRDAVNLLGELGGVDTEAETAAGGFTGKAVEGATSFALLGGGGKGVEMAIKGAGINEAVARTTGSEGAGTLAELTYFFSSPIKWAIGKSIPKTQQVKAIESSLKELGYTDSSVNFLSRVFSGDKNVKLKGVADEAVAIVEKDANKLARSALQDTSRTPQELTESISKIKTPLEEVVGGAEDFIKNVLEESGALNITAKEAEFKEVAETLNKLPPTNLNMKALRDVFKGIKSNTKGISDSIFRDKKSILRFLSDTVKKMNGLIKQEAIVGRSLREGGYIREMKSGRKALFDSSGGVVIERLQPEKTTHDLVQTYRDLNEIFEKMGGQGKGLITKATDGLKEALSKTPVGGEETLKALEQSNSKFQELLHAKSVRDFFSPAIEYGEVNHSSLYNLLKSPKSQDALRELLPNSSDIIKEASRSGKLQEAIQAIESLTGEVGVDFTKTAKYLDNQKNFKRFAGLVGSDTAKSIKDISKKGESLEKFQKLVSSATKDGAIDIEKLLVEESKEIIKDNLSEKSYKNLQTIKETVEKSKSFQKAMESGGVLNFLDKLNLTKPVVLGLVTLSPKAFFSSMGVKMGVGQVRKISSKMLTSPEYLELSKKAVMAIKKGSPNLARSLVQKLADKAEEYIEEEEEEGEE